MQQFIAKHQDQIAGVLSGFDRLVLRGTLRSIAYGQGMFQYHYSVHPVFGFLNARIQTWFPFSIQICLNGREWLAHQMDAVGLDYLRDDNCFPWIEDWPTAQQLMDQQLKVEWPTLLDDIA